MRQLFKKRNYNFDFIKNRKWGYILSILVVVIALGSFFTKGLNYGIDFEGGVLVEVSAAEPIDMQEMRAKLGFLKDVSMQSAGEDGKTILIQCQPDEGKTGNEVVTQIKDVLGVGYTYERVEVIGPTIGNELKTKSLLASVLALLAIAIYIWFRFEWPFAIGCLLALAHDLIAVVGIFSLFGLDFNMVVVAGILSLAGYDCNDTIVTYDRIRENLKKYRKMSIDDILNRSINETLSRTILTGLTTMVVVLVLLFVGGETLRGFSLAMVLGTLFGTYSSIYVAVPFLRRFDIRAITQGGETAGFKPSEK